MSARQFYLMLFIFTISLKVQKMPALLAAKLGKDGYVLLLFYFVIDVIGILLAFFIINYTKKYNFQDKGSWLYMSVRGLILLACSVYFMLQCLLMYESIQDLFSHILFDNLSWTLFSLLLIAVLFYLAVSGLKNIGRVTEVYFFIIILSYFIIAVFGGTQTDFSSVLPFQTINMHAVLDCYVPFNLWFGDFFLVLFIGRYSNKIKLKWTLLTYTLSMALTIFMFIAFFGIYGVYSSAQSSLISVISEHSMLGVDVGRVDWFLILFTQIGTILSSSLCLYLAGFCISKTFPKIKNGWIFIFLVLLLYLADVFLFVDVNTKIRLFVNLGCVLSTIVKCGVFLFLLLACLLSIASKNHSKNSDQSNSKSSEKKTGGAKTKPIKTKGAKA